MRIIERLLGWWKHRGHHSVTVHTSSGTAVIKRPRRLDAIRRKES